MRNGTVLRVGGISRFNSAVTWKRIPLLWLLALLLSGCTGISGQVSGPLEIGAVSREIGQIQEGSTSTPMTCPTTLPPEPAFIPPHPYSAEPPFEGEFWRGSPALWTLLPQDGAWRGLPYSEQSGYTQKVFFWRDGYDPAREPQPGITLSGVRLDGKGESFTTDHSTHAMGADIGSAMLVGVEIPTEGCWLFTASYKGELLEFTLSVEP